MKKLFLRAILLIGLAALNLSAAPGRLFPTGLAGREWIRFAAQGYAAPACGVIFRKADPVTCGMALGGIDTGCLDLETSGLLGYATIFKMLDGRFVGQKLLQMIE